MKDKKEFFEEFIQIWKQSNAPSNEQEFEICFIQPFALRQHEQKAFEDLSKAIYEDCCDAGLAKRPPTGMDDRFTALTLGLDQAYQGKLDLEQCNEHIYETFKWFGESHDKYLSPSFAIIQSSGTGKTKLMKQYKKAVAEKRYFKCPHVLLLLCLPAGKDPPKDHAQHFDHLLYVPSIPFNSSNEVLEEERKNLLDSLDTIHYCQRNN